VTMRESFGVNPNEIAIETRTEIEHEAKLATPIAAREVYNITDIKRTARIAVETAFKIASPIFSSEEFTIEEVRTNE